KITEYLGVQPSNSWRKGDLIRGGPNRQRTGGWVLNAPSSKFDDLYTQLEDLLRLLEDIAPKINLLTAKYDSSIVVGYSSAETNIGIVLDKSQIKRLHELGVYIGFDIYPVQA